MQRFLFFNEGYGEILRKERENENLCNEWGLDMHTETGDQNRWIRRWTGAIGYDLGFYCRDLSDRCSRRYVRQDILFKSTLRLFFVPTLYFYVILLPLLT